MNKKVIIGIVCALAAAATIGVVAVFAGTFNPKAKVVNATKKTIKDSGYLIEALSKFNYKSSKMTYSVNAEYNDIGVEALFTVNGNDKGVSAKLINDKDTVIEAAATIDKKDVKVSFPGLDYEKQLVYRYTSEDKGDLEDYVGNKTLEQIDSAIKAIYDVKYNSSNTDKLEKQIKKWAKKLESEKLDKKSFKVDGEKRDCKGYKIIISEDNMVELAEIVADWAEEEYGDTMKDYMDGKGFDSIVEEVEKYAKQIKEIELNCYLYKSMLAAIVIEINDEKLTVEFNGSEYRMQEIVAYTGKKSDENYVLKVTSKIRDKKETTDIEIPDRFQLEYSYDKSNGKYEVSFQKYSSWSGGYKSIAIVKGTLDAGSSKLTMKVSSITVNDMPIELDKLVIELSSSSSMPKMKGKEFRIDEADKDDLEDEFKELSSELTSTLNKALSDSGLGGILNNLR